MQTFLPHPDFEKVAEELDYRRLGKQRVETMQILKVLRGKGRILKSGKVAWQNHPAVLMWKGFEGSLAMYGVIICAEWKRRGYKDTVEDKIRELMDPNERHPDWLGDPTFHLSHQSNLIRKKPDFYTALYPGVSGDLPYKWPVEPPPKLKTTKKRFP
jgi:hypothetical protein